VATRSSLGSMRSTERRKTKVPAVPAILECRSGRVGGGRCYGDPEIRAVPRPIAVANRVRSFICIFISWIRLLPVNTWAASPQLAVLIGQASNEAALVRRCLARSCRSVGAKHPDSCPPHAEIAA
jgi:hypothetical protein